MGAAKMLSHALVLQQLVELGVGSEDDRRISLFELQQHTYRLLQEALLQLGHAEWALGVCAQAKARALSHMLGARELDDSGTAPLVRSDRERFDSRGSLAHLRERLLPRKQCAPEEKDFSLKWEKDWQQVQRMAREEGCVVVEYYFLSEQRLAVWVVSEQGILVDYKVILVSKTGADVSCGTFQALLTETRKSMNVEGWDSLRAARMSAVNSKSLPLSASGEELHAPKEWTAASLNKQNPVPRDAQCRQERAKCKDSWKELQSRKDLQEDATRRKPQSSESACGALLEDIITCAFERITERAMLGRLYRLLLQPVHVHIAQARELLILPHKELFEVPWAALLDADGSYLIQRCVIRVAPSLRVARQAASQCALAGLRPGLGAHALVVGNPSPNREGALPQAESEAEFVALKIAGRAQGLTQEEKILAVGEEGEGLVVPVVREGAHIQRVKLQMLRSAHKARVVENLNGAAWVHLSCHVCKSTNSILLAAPSGTQVSADDELTMQEIQNAVRLRAGATVFLSACNTGRGDIKAEGIVGLARGFLAVGAGSAVVSLWSVDDGSTAFLMRQAYKHLDAGMTVAQALRLAMIEMMQGTASGGDESGAGHGFGADFDFMWRRPMHWAGFIVAGAQTCLPCRAGLYLEVLP